MTTIAYDKPIKDFIAGLDATGHVTHESYDKTSVTLHHNGGRLSLQGILEVWKTRRASAHFHSDGVGALGQYVRVQEYAWATGTTEGNMRSISIEMANSTLAPTWRVADATWQSAARLAGWLFAFKIKGRPRPTSSNLFYHHHWKSTECAGPYMDSIYSKVLAEAQKWYDFFTKPSVPTLPPGSNWEDIMALFNTKEEYIAATSEAVFQGNYKYWAAFFRNEVGTGDAILDDMRAFFAREAKSDADLLAATKANKPPTVATQG